MKFSFSEKFREHFLLAKCRNVVKFLHLSASVHSAIEVAAALRSHSREGARSPTRHRRNILVGWKPEAKAAIAAGHVCPIIIWHHQQSMACLLSC